MTSTRTIYIVDGTGFLAPGLDDEARVAQRAKQMLPNITEPCEENVVKHHLAASVFASQNEDLTRIETDEYLFDRKLLDIMPEGGSYEVVELRTRFSPSGNIHVSPSIGFSRIEFGACRMLNRGIRQDQLLAFLEMQEVEHDLLVVHYSAFHRAVIREGDIETYLGHAKRHIESDPSEKNVRRLASLQRDVDAHWARKLESEAEPDAPQLGGMR